MTPLLQTDNPTTQGRHGNGVEDRAPQEPPILDSMPQFSHLNSLEPFSQDTLGQGSAEPLQGLGRTWPSHSYLNFPLSITLLDSEHGQA